MIYDKITNAKTYSKILPEITRAAEFVLNIGKNAKDGRYDIDGDKIFAMISTYDTKLDRKLPFEGHRKYIDFQCLLSGEERIDVIRGSGSRLLERYSPKRDIYFVHPPLVYSSIVLVPGNFVLLYPEDLHRPCQAVTKITQSLKLVVKIKI
jgi:YhcH/YjgK/YiaL family protein